MLGESIEHKQLLVSLGKINRMNVTKINTRTTNTGN
jgi:hypothetical protein